MSLAHTKIVLPHDKPQAARCLSPKCAAPEKPPRPIAGTTASSPLSCSVWKTVWLSDFDRQAQLYERRPIAQAYWQREDVIEQAGRR